MPAYMAAGYRMHWRQKSWKRTILIFVRSATINQFKQRITTLHSCGLSTILIKIKGSDDYCMSRVLGYSYDD